ncbi:MAG: ABC transporter ATP-binding protein [Desulfosarcinaceae bacterium]
MKPILDLSNLTMDFGGLRALDSVDLKIEQGQIVALIGPNGAGKTTLFNCITGIYNPSRGTVDLTDKDGHTSRLNGLKPDQVTARGMARTFQNIRLFQNMTVLENVMIGRHCRMKAGIAGAIIRPPKTRLEEKQVVADSYKILEKFSLAKYVNEFAKNLPYGAQRRLEIARAMATEPFLLLLDEPAAGMNTQETRDLDNMIEQLRDDEKISILLIEHDMKLVMSLSDRIYVVDYGKKIAEGTPDEISKNPEVIKAYLGEDADA